MTYPFAIVLPVGKAKSKNLELHQRKVIKSIKDKLREPYSLNESDALFLMKHLELEEVDLFVGNTTWTCGENVFDQDFNFHSLDWKAFFYTRHNPGAVVITNSAIYFLSREWYCRRAKSEFDGFDLGQRDTIRQFEIDLVRGESRFPSFSVRKNRFSEFTQAMHQMEKFELDPPSNPEFFDSHFMDVLGGETPLRYEPVPGQKFGLMEIQRPRHKPIDTPKN